jgi:RNA polymerase sigma factor (sigma-70 family)
MSEALISHGALKTLFIERLGWDHARGTERVVVAGRTVEVQRIAHKRGCQVFEHRTERMLVQSRQYVRQLLARVAGLAHEHILIVADERSAVQVWAWSFRDRYTGRLHPCFTNRIPPGLLNRVAELAVMIEEEEDLCLVDVTSRLADAFDDAADQRIFFRSPAYARQSDMLARRMRIGGLREFHDFVLFHQQLAAWFAQRYRALTDELENLTQVAMVGVLRAARLYDPDQGAAFATFAFHVMQTDCWRYLATALRMGRVPAYVYKPFITILRCTDRAWRAGGPVAANEVFAQTVADEGFTPDLAEDLRRFFQAKLLHPASVATQARLVGPVELEGAHEPRYREPFSEVILAEQAGLLFDAVATLEPTDQLIIRRRFGLDGKAATLEELGGRLRLTRERIRQREARALGILRQQLAGKLGMSVPADADDKEADDAAAD